MGEPVFLAGLAIVATTAFLIVRTIANAVAGRGSSHSDVAALREEVDQHAAALEDAESALALQSAQLAELQERVDFAERLLMQGGQQAALPPEPRRE